MGKLGEALLEGGGKASTTRKARPPTRRWRGDLLHKGGGERVIVVCDIAYSYV